MKFFLAFALSILVGTFAVTKRFSGVAVKDDLPHIACDVCERSVELVFEEVAKARSTNKALNEMQITEIIEDLLSTVTERGEWMRRIDIIEATVKDKRYLSLVEPGGTSTCKNECASIAKSCQSLMNEEIDVDNLSTMLWKNKSSLSDVKVRVHNCFNTICSES